MYWEVNTINFHFSFQYSQMAELTSIFLYTHLYTLLLFHKFLLCLFYLLNFLHLVRTHQADLIDSHLIFCFLFLVFAKRFDELLPNILIMLVSIILNLFLFILNPQSFGSFILGLSCLFIKLCHIFYLICILLSSKRVADKLLYP